VRGVLQELVAWLRDGSAGSMYPVGSRDLYVVIKINTLEEVSSVGACYLLC